MSSAEYVGTLDRKLIYSKEVENREWLGKWEE